MRFIVTKEYETVTRRARTNNQCTMTESVDLETLLHLVDLKRHLHTETMVQTLIKLASKSLDHFELTLQRRNIDEEVVSRVFAHFIEHYNRDVVEVVLRHRDVNIPLNHFEHPYQVRETALDRALPRSNVALIQQLIEHGASSHFEHTEYLLQLPPALFRRYMANLQIDPHELADRAFNERSRPVYDMVANLDTTIPSYSARERAVHDALAKERWQKCMRAMYVFFACLVAVFSLTMHAR